MTAKRTGGMALAVLVAGLVGGCAAALDPSGFRSDVQGVLPGQNHATDEAMSLLARGDYPAAERSAVVALRRNPKDPYALLTAGLVYQATGRYDLARQYYEVVITNQPAATIVTPGEGGVGPRSVVDVARENMAVVDKLTGRGHPRSVAQAGRPADGQAAMSGAPQVVMQDPGPPAQSASSARLAPTQAEANVAGRFRILKRLSGEGLITPDEYTRRRGTNLGALLPYSHGGTPAQGLERPTPPEEQVVDRLKELRDTLENRGITPRQHAVERTMILEALLPAEPKKVELPPLPPRDMIEAGHAVGRLERMRAAGLVSADELAKEKEALERALDGELSGARVAGTSTGLRHGLPPTAQAANGKDYVKAGAGVVLATAKSEADAAKAWETIRRKFPEQVDKLQATFRRVDLGEKGVRWRVLVGPLASQDEARKLCKTLKLHRQSCDPAAFEKAAGR